MGLYQDSFESADGGVYINTRDGTGVGITSTLTGGKQGLDVNLINSLSSGIIDESLFAYGTGIEQPVGGVFNDTGATVTTGRTAALRITAQRGLHSNLRKSDGTEIGDSNATGVWAKIGDGTNSGSFSATSEQFVQIRQGANAATVTAANELKTIDSNAGSILSLMKPTLGTISTPTVTTASTTALASNAARKGYSVYNTSAFPIFLAAGATATSSAFTVKVQGNSFWEQLSDRVYTGILTMISPTVTGTPTIAVTEYT